MKYTQTLFEKAEDLWKEAAEKPFVTEMAEGTLEIDRFRKVGKVEGIFKRGIAAAHNCNGLFAVERTVAGGTV